ncbi:MAG: ABC transporter ATP-binding protein [Bacteroidota bacterium]
MADTDTQQPGLDGRLLRRILAFLLPYRGWLVVALLLSVLGAYLGPLRPALIQRAIDEFIVTNDWEGLQGIVLILFGILLGEAIVQMVTSYLTQWIGQQAIFDLRTRLYRHIQRLPLSYFDRTPLGKIITRTTNDVEALSDLLSAGVVVILGNLLRLAFITYFMVSLNWQLALLALSVMPLMVWSTAVFRSKVRVAYRETRKQVAALNAFLQEHVTGMKIVQVFNREDEEAERFDTVNDAHRQAHIKTIFYFALFWPTVDIVASMALGIVLWYGGLSSMSTTLTLGVLVAFIQYIRKFFEPIRQLSDQYNVLQSAMAASERIFDVLDLDIAMKEDERTTPLGRAEGRITFENVWFAYEEPAEGEETNWILKDVSFTIEPGQTLALVGATGSGKTTILNLLMRFYEPQKGRVLIDGVDVRRLSLEDLRKNVGLVLQDVFLFSGSIERNITLGNERVDQDTVQRSAALVGADQFIERLPEKYQQDVRERGASLSHGQRQLLAFVRALVYDPAILVLDEATSSVDTESEEMIQQALDRLMDGRTTVAVAHRLSTIQNAEQILVVHNGRIRERGTHTELLRLDGLYRRLYELQFKEQEA